MSISLDTIRRTPAPGLPLHDGSEELREAWKSARDQALLAYRVWSDAAPREKRDAYVAYIAAADREAAAADHMGTAAVVTRPASAEKRRAR